MRCERKEIGALSSTEATDGKTRAHTVVTPSFTQALALTPRAAGRGKARRPVHDPDVEADPAGAADFGCADAARVRKAACAARQEPAVAGAVLPPAQLTHEPSAPARPINRTGTDRWVTGFGLGSQTGSWAAMAAVGAVEKELHSGSAQRRAQGAGGDHPKRHHKRSGSLLPGPVAAKEEAAS